MRVVRAGDSRRLTCRPVTNAAQKTILLTGGAGYIGSVLTPKLLGLGHHVTVLDSLVYGEESLAPVRDHAGFELVVGDIRDRRFVRGQLERGFDTVVHLAAISNDPSSELEPELTRQVNLDAVDHLMTAAKSAGVGRFLYASSASVYGIKEEEEVVESLPLEPITLYARYKAEGEAILRELVDRDFRAISVRAATVCGYSPRMRLDLSINILTEHAATRGRIRVFGGEQQRPNIHIEDLADFYTLLVEAPSDLLTGEAFNVSRSNAAMLELAEMIRETVDSSVAIDVVPSDDQRSYRLATGKAKRVLGFEPARSLVEAVREVASALRDGRIPEPASARYRNVQWLKERPHLMALLPEGSEREGPSASDPA